MELSSDYYYFKGRKVNYDFNGNLKLGDWVYGLLTKQFRKAKGCPILSCITSDKFGEGEVQVNTKTICQSTGKLRDLKDILLYENDIVYLWCFTDLLFYRVKRACEISGECDTDTSFVFQQVRLQFNKYKNKWEWVETGTSCAVDDCYEDGLVCVNFLCNEYDDIDEKLFNYIETLQEQEKKGKASYESWYKEILKTNGGIRK